MHAQLMGAAGDRLERKPGDSARSANLISRRIDDLAPRRVCSLPPCGRGMAKNSALVVTPLSVHPPQGGRERCGMSPTQPLSGDYGSRMDAAEHLPACDRRLAGGVGPHPPAAGRVAAAQREIDWSF